MTKTKTDNGKKPVILIAAFAVLLIALFVLSACKPKYTVAFDLNGGIGTCSAQSVTSGEKAASPGTPMRLGYTFVGWYTAANDGEPWDFVTNTVTGDITLYARWAAVYYTVTFDLNGASGSYAEQRIAWGSNATDPETPSWSGYEFVGWYTTPKEGGELWDFEINTVTIDVTLYARWSAVYYTVEFDLNGASGSYSEQRVIKGGKATDKGTPSRRGYTFAGWYTEVNGGMLWDFGTNMVTGNVRLYARWIEGTAGLSYTAVDGGYSVGAGTATDGEIIIPGQYNGFSVVAIDDDGFRNKTDMAVIEIPDSVINIGGYAFAYCDSLTSIVMSNNLTGIGEGAFVGCSSLISIEIPNGVTVIGDSLFAYCESLTSIRIPDRVTDIGGYAFVGCGSLTSIEIPNTVTTIGDYAFALCGSLTSIVIPNNVTDMGEYAFYCCYNLISAIIGNAMTAISGYTFAFCGSLTSVELPDSVTAIGEAAFYSCGGLTSIELPKDTADIGRAAFTYCGSLESIEIADSNAYYISIDGILFNKAKTELIRYPEGKKGDSYIIPSGVTDIGWGAFGLCCSLTSIELTDNVTSIGDWAFFGSGLISITMPDGVTDIGEYAFYDCVGLTSIRLSESLERIGYRAFYNCGSLISIIIPLSVTAIATGAFLDCGALTIKARAAGKPDGWDDDWNIGACDVLWGYTGDIEE
ncbi:MAG: leucine-rich repeat protein [Clostridiales bacterium]|jgi:uncharacterized repeat protein (TIGR02543 family)|nr:leucine-rich repeat protein [Clostridiales bacterium]